MLSKDIIQNLHKNSQLPKKKPWSVKLTKKEIEICRPNQ